MQPMLRNSLIATLKLVIGVKLLVVMSQSVFSCKSWSPASIHSLLLIRVLECIPAVIHTYRIIS